MIISQFTTAQAQSRLQSDGLEALGLTSFVLGPKWSDNATPTFDAAALTLSVTNLLSPFLGLLSWHPHGHDYVDAQGQPINVPIGVVRLHPHAEQRFFRLASARYASASSSLVHPLPVAMVMRLAATPDETPRRIEAGDAIPTPNGAAVPNPVVISFHDARGLIICPVAVAAMFIDLISGLPGLRYNPALGAVGDAGGLIPIAALDSGELVQFADLHGNLYHPAASTLVLEVVTPGINPGEPPTTVPVDHGNGYVQLTTNQSIQASAGDGGRILFGFAPRGTLSRTALTLPTLPTALTSPPFATTNAPVLSRQFFRVAIVDAIWHLLGNRTGIPVNGVPPDDQTTPPDLIPAVRDRVNINYFVDGVNTLAAIDGVVSRFQTAGIGLIFACSPAFSSVGLPPVPATGVPVGWPAFPPPLAGTPGMPVNLSPAIGISAQWIAAPSQDVVVTISAAATPKDAHVRVYPRRFIEIETIGAEPSFVRGDGGAAISDGVTPTQVHLVNPFGLGRGDPQPADVLLDVDIVIMPRAGRRKMWPGIRIAMTPGSAPPVTNNFSGTDRLPIIPPNMQGWCPVPLFGLPRSLEPPVVAPGTLTDLSRALASETVPRTAPRLPLMARFETVVSAGIPDPTATNGALSWQAVITGARWMPESRSAEHGNGNPGNPAGPDLHAAGATVTGQLAYDFAWHALRRAKPPLPFPGAPALLDGWLIFGAGDNMNEPVPPASDTAPNAGSSIGAALQTLAIMCDTPELSLAPQSLFDTPTTLQNIVNDLYSRIDPVGTAPTITSPNGDRLLAQIRREYWVAKKGRRDALWSLRRALGEARELVYIEGAQFVRTAMPTSSEAHALDLAQVIIDRMTANKALHVVVAVPRETDFAQGEPPMNFGPFVRQALAARHALVTSLPDTIKDRFAVFHPAGFPGRYTAIRSSVIVVDDVYSLVGTSHFRRRGMTFDGALDLVSLDRTIDEGYSRKVRNFRRALMASRLGVPIATNPVTANAEWVALEQPRAAFQVVKNALAQGGLGSIKPLWEGPTDSSVAPQTDDAADPDGVDGTSLRAILTAFLAEA